MDEESERVETVSSRPRYGTRDDIAVYMKLLPPSSSHAVMVRGRLRDVIQVVNKTEWKILEAEAYIDEFLDWYHGLQGSAN